MLLVLEEGAVVLSRIDDRRFELLQRLLFLVLSTLEVLPSEHYRREVEGRISRGKLWGEHDLIALIHQSLRHGDEEGQIDTPLAQGGYLHSGALRRDGDRLDGVGLDPIILRLGIITLLTLEGVDLLGIGDDLREHPSTTCSLLLVGR